VAVAEAVMGRGLADWVMGGEVIARARRYAEQRAAAEAAELRRREVAALEKIAEALRSKVGGG